MLNVNMIIWTFFCHFGKKKEENFATIAFNMKAVKDFLLSSFEYHPI
jgi:hypothetical protein